MARNRRCGDRKRSAESSPSMGWTTHRVMADRPKPARSASAAPASRDRLRPTSEPCRRRGLAAGDRDRQFRCAGRRQGRLPQPVGALSRHLRRVPRRAPRRFGHRRDRAKPVRRLRSADLRAYRHARQQPQPADRRARLDRSRQRELELERPRRRIAARIIQPQLSRQRPDKLDARNRAHLRRAGAKTSVDRSDRPHNHPRGRHGA